MSLLEQDTTSKDQIDQINQALLKLEKFEARDNKEYEVEAIINSMVYDQQPDNLMPSLYYLIL